MTDEELIAALLEDTNVCPAHVAAAAADRIEALVKESELQSNLLADAYGAILDWDEVLKQRADHEAMQKIEAAEAENARLREVADYILDGMAINAPEYEIDPDDDFLDGANSAWVCVVLTRLSNAMKPAPTVTAGWPTDEGEGSIIVGNVKGDSHD
jgi:hypothetical protein